MSLALRLSSYSDEYWDFKFFKNDGIHSIANYPAPMVAPMQHELLELLISENPSYKNMLDPFHGSGVTLVEGQSLGLDVWGIDINPYAHIISMVKLENYDYQILQIAIMQIKNVIRDIKYNSNYRIHTFPNISKWFRPDIIDDLSIIRMGIKMESNPKTRRYFWLCFGEIVKKYSNTRTSTFKLHTKETTKIENMENNVINDFIQKISETYLLLRNTEYKPFHLLCGDSVKIMKEYKNESFDIICTSPPYGDNGTTVTYGQFSSLQLLWIDNSDFEYDMSCLMNFSKIDSLSLGGSLSLNNAFYYSPLFSSYLSQVTPHKRSKLLRFYVDYENAFRWMARLLKPNGSMILTLGNRHVDRIEFPFIEINIDLARHYGLSLIHILTRNIVNKRMPIRVSKLADGNPVSSISKEKILLFKKEVG